MPTLHIIIGALAVAITSASITLLATSADQDFARSAAMIGMMIAVGSALYILIDRHMTRVESLIDRRLARVESATARVIQVEQDVLLAIRDRARLN